MNDFLFSPTKQFLFPSGKILAGGKIYVFIKHTDNLATLYNDEDVEIANPVILDSNGRATVKADDTYDYKLDVYSPYDELLFTATSYLTDNFERDFAVISTDGSVDVNVSIDGYTTNWDLSVSGSINEATSGKFDTSAFENFYTNTYGPTVSSINQKIDYISGGVDYLSATISGGYNSKLDVTAFNLYSAGVRGELNVITGNTAALGANTGLLSDRIIQNMNDINAVSGGLSSLSAYVNDCCSSLPETYVPYSATTITTASTAQLVDTNTVETMIISATSAIDTFSGVTTDSTLTGDGKNNPLGVAEVQTLSSEESISITSGDNEVILGVNSSWFDNAVNSAFSGGEVITYIQNNSATINDVDNTVITNSASWSQGTTYSSVSGTVIISGNDLEISNPAIKTGVPWILDGWSHSYDDSTAFNAGFQKVYNTYRLEHIMYYRQYPNPAHTGFSAELRQLDENYNILSSTMLYGIFDFTFTPVANCDMIWLYCSGTSAECQRGITDYYRTGNNTKWVENLAWENDTPTRNEFANLYENIAVNSGSWSEGTSIDFHYIEV